MDEAMDMDENLPVAVPIRPGEEDADADADDGVADDLPRLLEPESDEEEEDDVHFFPRHRHRRQVHHLLQGREMHGSATSYVYGMIQDDCTCMSVLSGWSTQVQSCSRIVQRIQEHPDDVFYRAPGSGRQPLHEACLRCRCLHVIQAILEGNNNSAMASDYMGNNPLQHLLVGVSTHALDPQEMNLIVEKLLAPNPSFIAGMANREGSVALHQCCIAPESMVGRDILQKIVNANPACASRHNNLNQTAFHLHCKRRNASTEAAQILIDAHAEAIHIGDGQGWAPLHYASANANTDLIRLIVNISKETAQSRTTTQLQTPLHILCSKNIGTQHLPAIRLLLSADPNAVNLRDGSHYTPLHMICRNPRVPLEIVQCLITPEAASVTDANNYLPLHHACEVGVDAKIIECLIKAYPIGSTVLTRKKDSALHLASCCNKSNEAIRLLIQSNPKALSLSNDYGFVPLHCACRANQPRLGIVQALVEACPESIHQQSHGGEIPLHMVSFSNRATCAGVIELLTSLDEQSEQKESVQKTMLNKVGNTPLHHACFQGSPFEHIKALIMSNPQWVTLRNNAGHSALQIICKTGRINESIIDIFARVGGVGIFSVPDLMGNLPLHSAMREETELESLRSLIRAYPNALSQKNIYSDTPLHLCCIRKCPPELVREVAVESSKGLEKALANRNSRLSPLLLPNTAGQTPIGIAMEDFQSVCRGNGCCVKSDYRLEHKRAFEVLATLVRIIHYGPSHHDDRDRSGNLLRACVSLHRRDVRLDPAFIRRALHLYPEEAREKDEDGNYPLHVEASIPIEKMSLLNGGVTGCCAGTLDCHNRIGLLRMLLEVYPEACRTRNAAGEFPLGLIIQNGRPWDKTFALVLRTFPQALHYSMGNAGSELSSKLAPRILEKVSKECGMETLHALISSRPDMVAKR